MNWLLIVLQFLPVLVDLAEKVFVNKGTGAEKKKFVLDALPAISKSIESVSTGGQKETWQVITNNIDVIGKTVDVAASVMFPGDDSNR